MGASNMRRSNSVCTIIVCLALASLVEAAVSSNENPLLDHLDARRRHVTMTLKSWRIQHAVKPKSRILPAKKTNPVDRGFKFTIGFRPTKERISRWFGVDEDSNQVQLGMLQKQFNHGTH
jgi:hypothetical protein